MKTTILSGENTHREIYCRAPREGLPGVAEGSLIKLVKGAYGLREAPRLISSDSEADLGGRFERIENSKGSLVLRDCSAKEPTTVGMLVLHVDDACYNGFGESGFRDHITLHECSQVLSVNRYELAAALVSRRDKQSARHPPSPATVHHPLRNPYFVG